MSYLLELLGRGLDHEIGEVLDRYYWSPPTRPAADLERLACEHPDRPEVRVQLALSQLRAGRTDEAIEHLSQACRHKPDDLAARVALAAAHVDAGRCDKALDELRTALQLRPGEAPLLLAMGFCCERLGRAKDAAEYFRDALHRDAELDAARERLAALCVHLDRIDEAIEQYRLLRQRRCEDVTVRTALAHLYHRAGRYDEAVLEFESAIAMEPENWALVDDEAESLAAGGQIREAIERLHALLERQGPFADLHVRLADLYGQLGDDAGAMSHYRQALDLQPRYLEATVKMGTQHLVSGRWEEAAEAFGTACELNDRVLTHYVGRGVAQLADGRRAEAMESFDLAHAVEPNSTILLAEMARLQLKSALADEYAEAFSGGEAIPVAEVDLDNDDLL
ncbi:MAG: tetratricopeptide repeat protein, partial [Planctomycetota bacterium]